MKSFKTISFSKVNFRSVFSHPFCQLFQKTLYNDAKANKKNKGLLVLESLWTFRSQNHLPVQIKTDFRETALSWRALLSWLSLQAVNFRIEWPERSDTKHYFNVLGYVNLSSLQVNRIRDGALKIWCYWSLLEIIQGWIFNQREGNRSAKRVSYFQKITSRWNIYALC